MNSILKYRKQAITISSILLCVCFFSKCINRGNTKNDNEPSVVSFNQFAGSASCASCHKNIYDSHIKTAHFHTSEVASEKNIKGSFDTGKNVFKFSTGGIVSMQKRNNEFYQVAYVRNVEKKSQRFDITIGSGTKGQSYLTWEGTKLFQLPITYFTANQQWCNSPGYPDKIAINRNITSRCLECHTTYAQELSDPFKEPVTIDKNRIIMGVDCERCHGAAAQHVAYQTQNPNEKTGKFIINPANFSRQQSLDLCALCHGGRLQKTKASFTFKPGDKLSDYFLIDTTAKEANTIDVHGNQYGLLSASKCFKMSNTLTCVTCHNSHQNEAGNAALFSQRCISCHNNKHTDAVVCKMTATLGTKINKDCISCHMPQQRSMAIAVLLQGNSMPTSATMHTHFIKAYPEETEKVLAVVKSK